MKEVLVPLLIAVAGVLVIAVSCYFISEIRAFREELRRVQIEIDRTTGAEQAHYLRERKALWRSFLTFGLYRGNGRGRR